MTNIRRPIIYFCLLMAEFSVGAETVAVWITERGLSATYTVEASSAWEAGAMDAAFDCGFIVWNATIARTAAEVKPTTRDIDRVSTIGADYLLWIGLDYDAVEVKQNVLTRISPISLVYQLIQLEPKAVLVTDGKMNLERTQNGKEDAKTAKALSSALFTRLKER